MGLLLALRKRQAAKRYARMLAPWLGHAFGMSEHYAAAQIRAAVDALRLERRYIGIAYAVFMPEEAYEALLNEMPIQFSRQEARDLFRRFSPLLISAPLGEAVPSLGHYVPSDSGHGP